jgi:lysophospholipase L1-like esterase
MLPERNSEKEESPFMSHQWTSVSRFSLAGLLFTCAVVSAKEFEAIPGAVGLFLPDTIYAVPGIETNVYFDNVTLVLNTENFAFDVTCDKGIQQAERWTFTPEDADVGSHAFILEVRDAANEIIARDSSVVVVSPKGARESEAVSALLIGDSLTHAAIYSQHLLDLCAAPGNPALTLIGSHVPDESRPLNRHEGYGGWTAQRFATHYTGTARGGDYKERDSPFLYPNEAGEPELDFQRYCDDVSGGEHPELVTIFLGCNDTFSATDETITARIEDMFAHLDQLLAAIHVASPETRIGLIVPVPPCASQDAFGANYKNGQTRWQYKRNQHAVVRAMYDRYTKNNTFLVSLIPAFTNLDCERNYPATTAPWNARTTAEAIRQNNGVHPSEEGYRQIGDAIYCWMTSE